MRFLVVEDEQDVCMAMVARVQDIRSVEKDEILFAFSSEDARKVILEKEIDCIISDIRIGSENGLDLIDFAQELQPGIGSIVVTAYDDFEYAQRAVRLGCSDFLLKPFTKRTLSEAIDRVLKRLIVADKEVKKDNRIEWVKTYVRLHLSENIDMQTLAKQLYIDYSYFSRLFKEATGSNFSTYVQRIRMEEACRLLLKKENITAIAEKIGYSNLMNFSRAFTNFYGISPSKFQALNGIGLYSENKNSTESTSKKDELININQLLKDICTAVKDGKKKHVEQLVKEALSNKTSAITILNEGLIIGMTQMGEMFKNGEVYVPEILVAARAMKAGIAVLKPLLAGNNVKPLGIAAVGTVKGDLHDIGKNLVAMMLEGNGFLVVDLGEDVAPEKYVEAVKNGAKIICMSALLTTTMPSMAITIQAIKDAGLRDKVKVLVGGAPVTIDFANKIGADGYTADAASAAELAKELLLHENSILDL